jgi:hypothetical protein
MTTEWFQFQLYSEVNKLAKSGGGGSPSNWSDFPAISTINCGGNAVQQGYLESAGTGGKPLVYWNSNQQSNDFPLITLVHTNGGGGSQPGPFTASKYTYIKNDPDGNPNEFWSLITAYNTEAGQWTLGPVWEGYIGLPFMIGGVPITFSVGANDVQQLFIKSENGGSGRLWVDSNGSLYWNSNVLSVA